MKTPLLPTFEHPMTLKYLAPAATALALAFGSAHAPAEAAFVSFQYTAVGIAGTVTEGATVVGRFGFDTAAPDHNPSAEFGNYVSTGFIEAEVSGGVQDGVSLTVSDLQWQVANRTPAMNGDALLTVYSGTFVWLEDASGGALPSDALPGALSIADFMDALDTRMLRLYDTTHGQHTYELSALSRDGVGTAPAPVPVPGTGPLLAAAGLALVWVGRRRPRHGDVDAG